MAASSLREQVTTKQGAGLLLREEPTFPGVWQVWRIEPTHGVFAQRQRISVGEGAGRAIREVFDRDHRSDGAAQRYGLWGDAEPFVQRAALVRLYMGKPDIANVFDGQDARHRFTHQRKHLSRARVKEQWFIIHDEILVERKLARTRDIIVRNRAIVDDWLAGSEAIGPWIRPRAGAIGMVPYDGGANSSELAEHLRSEWSVLVVPGDHFGLDGFIRIGFGGEEEELVEALACIGRALEAHAAQSVS